MATLAEIRAKYPQYSDLDDRTLLDGLYRKHYADMPRAEFDKRLGVAREPTTAETVSDVADQAVRGVYRGLDNILSIPNRVVSGAINLVAPGQGDRFAWPEQGYIRPPSEVMSGQRVAPQTEAGRYADAVGQAVGSSVVPGAVIAGKAAQVAAPAAQTTMGAIGQQAVNAYRLNPGAAVAADVAAATGGGVGQQMAQEGGFGPVGQMVGGVAGGLAPLAAGAAAQGVVQPIRRAYANQGRQGAYGAMVDDLGGNVDDLANQVAVGGTRGSQAINRRTLDVLGEEMERAGGNVQHAQAATIARIAQEYGIQPASVRANIRALTEVHGNSRLMLGEYPAVAASDAAERLRQPGNIDLDTLGRSEFTATQGSLDYLANNGNAQSAQAVRNAVGRRQEDLAPAMRETLEGFAPQVQGRPASIADSADMIEAAQQTGRAAYQAAYRAPIDNREIVYRLPRVIDATLNYAATRSGDTAAAIRRAADQFFITVDPALGGGRYPMGTLQQLQDARAAVRDQITALRTGGQNSAAAAVQRFYDQITGIMSRASPAWRQANDQWADMNFLRIGAELGDAFATRAGPQFRQQLAEFGRLAPQAQDIVRIHFLQKLTDKLDNLGDTHAVSKLFATDHNRVMIRELFGNEAAVSFTRAVRDQRVAEASGRMMANSATHRRGVAQKQKDAETGLVAAVENANARGVRNWLLERATQIMTERRDRPMADILTTPMSDTARVAQHLYNLRQQQQRLQQFAQPRMRPPGMSGQMAPNVNPLMEDQSR